VLEGEVGEYEKRDIRAQVARILRDLGNPEPPISLADARSLLSLDLKYYSRSDPGLVSEITHRFTLFAKKSLPDVGRHLLSALSKSKLCAFWVPDSSQILVDIDVPKRKHRWIEAHEITHSVTPWHRAYLLGDNSHTLDPGCHANLEAEANYGAGQLLFLGDKLSAEARDLELSFASIKALSKRYGNSIVSTFWRAVEERDPTQPVFGVVSVHPIHPEIGSHNGPNPWRYFIRSAAFQTQFSTVEPDIAFDLVRRHATGKKTGPIFTAMTHLSDANGDSWEFKVEAFSTGYAVLTLGFAVKRATLIVPAPHVLAQ
jgi:hypothetical protein